MGQCNEFLYNSRGKIVEQCQWGINHDGECVFIATESKNES